MTDTAEIGVFGGSGFYALLDGLGRPEQAHPTQRIAFVEDRDVYPRIAEQVRRPAAADTAVHHELFAVEQVPDDRLPGRAVGINGGDRSEMGRRDEFADMGRECNGW